MTSRTSPFLQPFTCFARPTSHDSTSTSLSASAGEYMSAQPRANALWDLLTELGVRKGSGSDGEML